VVERVGFNQNQPKVEGFLRSTLVAIFSVKYWILHLVFDVILSVFNVDMFEVSCVGEQWWLVKTFAKTGS
jgi:hypothetical protein